MNSSLPRTKQQRSQPAVYQLHQVQDLRFLRGNLSPAVGIVVVGNNSARGAYSLRVYSYCRDLATTFPERKAQSEG